MCPAFIALVTFRRNIATAVVRDDQVVGVPERLEDVLDRRASADEPGVTCVPSLVLLVDAVGVDHRVDPIVVRNRRLPVLEEVVCVCHLVRSEDVRDHTVAPDVEFFSDVHFWVVFHVE